MMAEENEYIRYVYLLTQNQGTASSVELIRDHVSHLKELDRKGQLVLCGPFSDFRGGMVIIKAGSFEEAKEIAEADPFVKSGFESYELRTWELSCEENNHMGMG